jgi:hypothetical protein
MTVPVRTGINLANNSLSTKQLPNDEYTGEFTEVFVLVNYSCYSTITAGKYGEERIVYE